MEAKKSSSKQVVAILLLVIGLAAGVFGVLGPPVPWALVLPSGNPANRWNIL